MKKISVLEQESLKNSAIVSIVESFENELGMLIEKYSAQVDDESLSKELASKMEAALKKRTVK